MKKFKSLTYAFAFLFVIGFSSCTEDETLAELLDDTTLAEPTAGDGNNNGTGVPPVPPLPPTGGGNN